MSGKNKYKLSFIFLFCLFAFSIFFLTSPSQSYYTPEPYPYYPPPTNYSLPPINININLGGFPGSYPMGYPAYMGYPPSGYLTGTSLYGNPLVGFFPATAETIRISTDRFSFIHAAVDGDYIYLLFGEGRGRIREALAIFGASGSDEYEYLSHITLYEPGNYLYEPQPGPREIIVKDDLAVIGGDDQGMVYLVDISEKDDPELINKLILGNKTMDDGASDKVTGLAIEDEVLFVSVPFFMEDESRIFAVDISNPEETDEDDDLLDSYTLDDYEIYGMVSSPDHLYIVGKDSAYPYTKNEWGATILIMDTSDPRHLSLEEVFDDLDDPSGNEPRDLSVEIAGDYLFVTCGGDSSGSKLRIIDITDPEDPDLISSSKKMTGTQSFGNRYIAVKDNYAYVLASDTISKESSKIYVYDISDPEDAVLVETKELSGGEGYDLHLVDDRLFVHIINQGLIKLIDISDPEDLSLEGAADLSEILEEEEALDDWGYTGYVVPSYVYPPYGSSYSPPPYYTPSPMAVGYNIPYRTSSGGFWNSPNYYGYAQPLYGSNHSYTPGFSFNYGQPLYGGYPNYGPVPGFGYAPPPYYSGWRRF